MRRRCGEVQHEQGLAARHAHRASLGFPLGEEVDGLVVRVKELLRLGLLLFLLLLLLLLLPLLGLIGLPLRSLGLGSCIAAGVRAGL